MKRTTMLIAAVAAVLAFSGCDALMNQENLFAKFEPDLTKKYNADLTGSSLLSSLSSDTQSSSFFAGLASNPDTVTIIVDNLTAIINDETSSPADIAAAALYKTQIILNTSEAGDVVNSLANALMDIGGGSDGLVTSLLSPIESMVQEPTPTPEFISFVTTLLDLAATYDALADNIAEATITGSTAQSAAVVYVLATIIEAIEAPTQGEKIEALYSTLFMMMDDNPDNDNDIPLQLSETFDFSTSLLGASNDSNLVTILEAANLSFLTDLLAQLSNSGE